MVFQRVLANAAARPCISARVGAGVSSHTRTYVQHTRSVFTASRMNTLRAATASSTARAAHTVTVTGSTYGQWAFRAGVASTALVGLTGFAALEASDYKEKATGISYPEELCLKTAGAPVTLCGAGVRKRAIFNVYAIGLYVDPATKQSLQGKSDDDIYRQVLSTTKTNKVMRLVMARGVDGPTMRDGIQSALKPRLPPNEASNLTEFESLFPSTKLEQGAEILMHWNSNGELHTFVDGKPGPVIKSELFCQQLFDVWLGSEPVSDSARKHLIDFIR
eukprot:GFYU01008061.1.p2 GENE.GFYU01008061.1~~GFYU01008061.1.p2  ORF type:complete len:277 (-),score=78.79 GFYU01008061.1:190-1020(-)